MELRSSALEIRIVQSVQTTCGRPHLRGNKLVDRAAVSPLCRSVGAQLARLEWRGIRARWLSDSHSCPEPSRSKAKKRRRPDYQRTAASCQNRRRTARLLFISRSLDVAAVNSAHSHPALVARCLEATHSVPQQPGPSYGACEACYTYLYTWASAWGCAA